MELLRAVLNRELPVDGHRGRFPGAVAAVAVDGSLTASVAVGEALRYADGAGTVLPESERVPATEDTVYDLASITKVFTAVVALSLVEDGLLALDEPVVEWLPELVVPPLRRHHDPLDAMRRRITLRQLLTHTAGFPSSRRPIRAAPSPAAGWALLLDTPLAAPPGSVLCYSDVSYLFAGLITTRAGGAGLDSLVRRRICEPLGLADTMFRPPPALHPRVAATEDMPGRAANDGPGCVRGFVHDETAYALGGVAGHAGIFGTARDLVKVGEMLRCGGAPILRPETVAEMTRDQLPGGIRYRPPAAERAGGAPPFGHGLGVRLRDTTHSGPLTEAYGHVGFTGTSLIVDPVHRLTVVLLTNRVHPSRTWSDTNPVRRAVAAAALTLAT